jgi:predicted RNase H-like HicB family nuclease
MRIDRELLCQQLYNEGKWPLAIEETIMDWRVVLEQDPETGDWAAWCPELPGCASAGETEEEAEENIREAIALYLEPSDVQLSPGAKTRVVVVQ